MSNIANVRFFGKGEEIVIPVILGVPLGQQNPKSG